ncbi:carbohydrate ABC transporter permease [Paenibacillus macerans]|uniref:carbohydrate ABC transporter permease n=1 Tax=Paenibacillus macerans TaxID=44252 RepID=UPI002040752D|nr:carbohydrate ABC transporter permease [Paenibacillus macerans]MCM3699903.1 carbohydrate ABC transporter permease [Paenibacillus macerans]
MQSRLISNGKWFNLLVYVVLILSSAFALIPILWAVSTSLKSEAMIVQYPPQWIPAQPTFENYANVLFHSNFPRYFLNSMLVAAVSILASLFISAHAAYAASRFHFRGKKIILFLILMTSMIPGIAILIPLYLTAVKVGLYDTFIGMILIYTAWRTPMLIWVLRGFFDSVPKEIEEAAKVDGSSPLRTFYQLILPVSQPGLAAGALLSAIYVWNDFLVAFSFTTKDELRLLSVGLYNYITQYGINWGQLMAAVVISVIPVVVLFVCLQSKFVDGLSAGAVKG